MAHLQTWNTFDASMLLAFQLAIIFLGASLMTGHVFAALLLVVVFGAFLALTAAVAKSFWG
jgi:type IV secretory pathway VirB2 component (pilin)